MTTLLADHNLEGHAQLLLGTLQALGWAELLDIRVATFGETGPSRTSPDREVWRRAQALGMVLLTANRRRRERDSLEQTLRDEVTPASLPVLTLGNGRRFLAEREYRLNCAERVAAILFDLEQYRGITRLYIS